RLGSGATHPLASTRRLPASYGAPLRMRGDPMGPSPNRGLRVGLFVVTLLGTSAVRASSSSSPPPAAPAPAAVTALLSVASGGAHGDADSFAPSLSADGSTVAFSSLATNLTAPEPVEV